MNTEPNINVLTSAEHFFKLIQTFEPFVDRMCRSYFTHDVHLREGDASARILNNLLRTQFDASHPEIAGVDRGKALDVSDVDALIKQGFFNDQIFSDIITSENPHAYAQDIIINGPVAHAEVVQPDIIPEAPVHN